MKKQIAAAMAAIAVLAGAGAEAQSAHVDQHHEEGGHELDFPHHTLGVFVGDTNEGSREQGLTLGLEYEYRATERFGVGAIAEHVWGDFNTSVYVLPVALHTGSWKLYAGPGIEDSDEGSETLLRVGVEYGFHAGAYEISPELDVDFVDGEHLFIVGFVIARPF